MTIHLLVSRSSCQKSSDHSGPRKRTPERVLEWIVPGYLYEDPSGPVCCLVGFLWIGLASHSCHQISISWEAWRLGEHLRRFCCFLSAPPKAFLLGPWGGWLLCKSSRWMESVKVTSMGMQGSRFSSRLFHLSVVLMLWLVCVLKTVVIYWWFLSKFWKVYL